MSAWGRIRRWLRLDTDGERADMRRYDESERKMEAQVRVLEDRVEAMQARVRARFERELRDLERGLGGGGR